MIKNTVKYLDYVLSLCDIPISHVTSPLYPNLIPDTNQPNSFVRRVVENYNINDPVVEECGEE